MVKVFFRQYRYARPLNKRNELSSVKKPWMWYDWGKPHSRFFVTCDSELMFGGQYEKKKK